MIDWRAHDIEWNLKDSELMTSGNEQGGWGGLAVAEWDGRGERLIETPLDAT